MGRDQRDAFGAFDCLGQLKQCFNAGKTEQGRGPGQDRRADQDVAFEGIGRGAVQ